MVVNPFIPYRHSVGNVELTATKANEYFDKRSAQATVADKKEITYVFVIPRDWKNKS